METKYEFAVGDKVLAYSDGLLYEAKCLKRRMTDEGVIQYFVHYVGFKSRWDEWTDEDEVLEINSINLGHKERREASRKKCRRKTVKKSQQPGTVKDDSSKLGIKKKKVGRPLKKLKQNPEPVVLQAPELIVPQSPEPIVLQAPEPVVPQAPEPVVPQAPEPVVLQASRWDEWTDEDEVLEINSINLGHKERREASRKKCGRKTVKKSQQPGIVKDDSSKLGIKKKKVGRPLKKLKQSPEPIVLQAPEPVVPQAPESVVLQASRWDEWTDEDEVLEINSINLGHKERREASRKKCGRKTVKKSQQPGTVKDDSSKLGIKKKKVGRPLKKLKLSPESIVLQAPEPVVPQAPEPVVLQASRWDEWTDEDEVLEINSINLGHKERREASRKKCGRKTVKKSQQPGIVKDDSSKLGIKKKKVGRPLKKLKQSPEPIVLQAPEPVVPQAPEPVVLQASRWDEWTDEDEVLEINSINLGHKERREASRKKCGRKTVKKSQQPGIVKDDSSKLGIKKKKVGRPLKKLKQSPEPIVLQAPEPVVPQAPESVVLQASRWDEWTDEDEVLEINSINLGHKERREASRKKCGRKTVKKSQQPGTVKDDSSKLGIKKKKVGRPLKKLKQSPEPIVLQAPEPVVPQAPESVVLQAPEPVVLQAPEPVVAQVPEPIVLEAGDPIIKYEVIPFILIPNPKLLINKLRSWKLPINLYISLQYDYDMLRSHAMMPKFPEKQFVAQVILEFMNSSHFEIDDKQRKYPTMFPATILKYFNESVNTLLLYESEKTINLPNKSMEYYQQRLIDRPNINYIYESLLDSDMIWCYVYGPIYLLRLIANLPKILESNSWHPGYDSDTFISHVEQLTQFLDYHSETYFSISDYRKMNSKRITRKFVKNSLIIL